jgi:protein tyrosine phosphatase (PTP) superfamily phosphohydrolase (DUF442 family)
MKRITFLFGLAATMLASCGPATPTEMPIASLGLRNLSSPFPKLACSGQPTEAQFDALKGAGINRVIHLRVATEKGTGWEEARSKQNGIEFIRLEIPGESGLTRENVDEFAKLIESEGEGNTLVSCGSSNRVGALFALKAFWLDNTTKEQAIAIGQSAGLKGMTAQVQSLLTR